MFFYCVKLHYYFFSNVTTLILYKKGVFYLSMKSDPLHKRGVGRKLRVTSFAIGLKIFAIIAGIKKYKSIIKKKKKKHGKKVVLAKTKLNSLENLIYKSLIDSYIIHNKFLLMNNELKKYVDMKEEINNVKTL